MHIAGEIPHPKYKITIFHMNHRLAVKLEDGSFEQWYKFRDGELADGIGSIKKLVNESFLENASNIFIQMKENKISNNNNASLEDGFDEIV